MNSKSENNDNLMYQNYYPYQAPPAMIQPSPPQFIQHPNYYWEWMNYYNNTAAAYPSPVNYYSSNTNNQNELFQNHENKETQNGFTPSVLPTPASYIQPCLDPTTAYFYMAQYYQQQQQQALYYHHHQQQFYEQQQQQQQNIKDIELDAQKDEPVQQQVKNVRKDEILLLNRSKAHVKAVFSMNKLIKIKASSPNMDGQSAVVEMHSLNDILDYDDGDETSRALHEFPGPLLKQSTSNAEIVQFCQRKVRECQNNSKLLDSQSYALLWEYLALLVRQNGVIDLRKDIAPMLLNETQDWSFEQRNTQTPSGGTDTPSSEIANITDGLASINVSHQHVTRKLTEDEILIKLRQLLASGQRLDAIDWSIKHNLWSHALFIAITQQPQIDAKLIQKIKLKFINSFQLQDPLKTCYQLYCGRLPTITTISNHQQSEWNDWRRHLAIIVSNKDLHNNDLVFTSIKTMGDNLATNNRIAASHFCYLLANVQFGNFNKNHLKLFLLDLHTNHFNLFSDDFDEFCQLSAIQATEVYEYATGNVIETLIKYKLIYTNLLCDYGFLNEALRYIENISKQINLNPSVYLDEISTAYKLGIYLYSYLIEQQIQNQEPRTTPKWFTELENNFKELVCKNYNKKFTCESLKQQYKSHNNPHFPLTPISDAVDNYYEQASNKISSWNDEDELEMINNGRYFMMHEEQQQQHAKLPIKIVNPNSTTTTTSESTSSELNDFQSHIPLV